MTTRPLEEQFAALPKDIQGRMFAVLDVIIGMSHDEKALTAEGLQEILQVDEEGCRDYWHPSREWGDEVLTRCPRGYGFHTLADWVPRAERTDAPRVGDDDPSPAAADSSSA